MTAPSDAPPTPAREARAEPWTALALLVAALVLLPVVSVALLALSPEGLAAWPQLAATVLPRYAAGTAMLMAVVGAASVVIGAGAAWAVTFYAFPGAGALRWLLFLPLAVPSYVAAYALVDFLEYAGPVQVGLRALFGWESARDYAFPRIRSRGGAAFVLTMALYPYVFLLARAAFRDQSGHVFDVARALGAGPWRLMLRVGLPLARPAIAAGAAIVMMEVAAEYGAVDYFAVQTLTTGIFTVWLEGGNRAGAAQIALAVLVVVLALTWIEAAGRRRARVHGGAKGMRPVAPRRLRGWRAAAMAAACWAPFVLGFVLPVGVMASHAVGSLDPWQRAGAGAGAGQHGAGGGRGGARHRRRRGGADLRRARGRARGGGAAALAAHGAGLCGAGRRAGPRHPGAARGARQRGGGRLGGDGRARSGADPDGQRGGAGLCLCGALLCGGAGGVGRGDRAGRAVACRWRRGASGGGRRRRFGRCTFR